MSINVLLADDSVPAQNMGKKILVDAGYTVVTVNNGLEALRKITESAPDVAILDIFMPGYTGLEICKRLRAAAATAALPVVLTVGKMEPYRPEEGELVRSNAVIVKPFAAAELIAAVRSLIGAPSAGAAAQLAPSIQVPPAKATTEDLRRGQDWGAQDVDSPVSLAANQAAAPEPNTGVSTEPEEDEPLFALREPSANSREPLLSDAASDGLANLAFDPGAKRMPFSASAADFLPTAPDSDSGQGSALFTEFDLEPESSLEDYSPASDVSTEVEPLLAAREMTSSPVEEVEPESLDIPALDPLLEVQQARATPSEQDDWNLDFEEPPEQIFQDSAAGNITPASEIPTSPDVPISSDEEARRAAFEALFNSDEVPPLEEVPDWKPTSVPVVLPSISDSSKDFAWDAKTDAELELLGHNDLSHFVDPGMHPDVVDEKRQEDVVQSTIGTSPDHELLLDDALAQDGWHANTVSLPQMGANPDLPGAAAETAPTEMLPDIYAEPEKPVEEPAWLSEIAPFAPEAALVLEETVEREPAHSEAEKYVDPATLARVAEEAAILHVEPAPGIAEVAPEHVEAAPIPVGALEESATEEASPVESAASLPDELVLDNPSFPGVTAHTYEAERVHQAVERVFERLKPLLIAAIVRELARSD